MKYIKRKPSIAVLALALITVLGAILMATGQGPLWWVLVLSALFGVLLILVILLQIVVDQQSTQKRSSAATRHRLVQEITQLGEGMEAVKSSGPDVIVHDLKTIISGIEIINSNELISARQRSAGINLIVDALEGDRVQLDDERSIFLLTQLQEMAARLSSLDVRITNISRHLKDTDKN